MLPGNQSRFQPWRIRAWLAGWVAAALIGCIAPAWGAFGVWSSIGPYGAPIQSLAVDPGDAQLAYAATSFGLYRTTDAGATWSNVSLGAAPSRGINAVATVPGAPNEVYMADQYGTLYHSTNAGGAWSPLSGAPAGAASQLVVSPNNPNVLYACDSAYHSPARLYVSSNQGADWTTTTVGASSWSGYVKRIAVNPGDASQVFVICEFSAKPGSYLYRSTDQGGTWTPDLSGTSGLPAGQPSLGAVIFEYGNSLTAYLGTAYNGVYRSTDSGSSWSAFNNGLSNAGSCMVGTLLSLPASPQTLVASVTISGSGIYHYTGGAWSQTWSGLTGGVLAASPASVAQVYLGSNNVGSQGVYVSGDTAATWAERNAGIQGAQASTIACLPGPFYLSSTYAHTGLRAWNPGAGDGWQAGTGLTGPISQFVHNPARPEQIYAAPGGTVFGLFYSGNSGAAWALCTAGYPAMTAISRVAIGSTDPDLIYAAQTSGSVFMSPDNGTTWNNVTYDLPASTAIGDMVLDPTDDTRLYIATWMQTANQIYRYHPDTHHWEALTNGLPALNAFCLRINPQAPNQLLVGLRNGIYQSTNYGANWTPFGTTSLWVKNLAFLPAVGTQPAAVAMVSDRVYWSTDNGATWPLAGSGEPGTDDYATGFAYDASTNTLFYSSTFYGVMACTLGPLATATPTPNITATPTPGTPGPTTPVPTATATPTSSPTAPVAGQAGAYPNPAHGQPVTFTYRLETAGPVKISIFNTAGRLAARLEESKPAGWQNSRWDPKGCAAGIYFYILEINGQKQAVKKLALVP